MAVVKVQSVTGAGPTLVLNGVVAGNCLTYQSSYFRGTSTGLAEAVPTDTNGTFTVGRADTPQVLSAQDQGASGFFQKNCAAGTHTVTPEANTGFNGTLTEWSGLDTVSPLIVGNSGKSNGTGTSQATGASATASSGDLALIQHGMAATITGNANVGYTDPVANYTTLLKVLDDATNVATLHAFRVLSASGTENATFNWTYSQLEQFWQASIFVLKAAPSGSGPALGVFHGDGPGMGPRLRRMQPQKYPDTIPFVQDGSGVQGPFRRGMGPRMRFRLAQRFPDNSVNAYSLSVVSGTYVLSGIAAPLQHNDDLVATTGTYVVTGIAAALEHGYLISPAKGAYILTGMAVTFSRAYVLSAATGVYSLTGVVLNLIVGRLVSAASGAYVLAGISDSFLRGYTVAPSSGPYTLVGNTATLTYSGATASPSPTQNPFLASAPKMMNRR